MANAPRMNSIKCAIYTRKSSEEGLEQDFNSLHAQREACESYIKSQKHEGWQVLPTIYDDGGFSGGSMERPALQQLLADIQTGKINIVVVYKVDRLTRSLGNFGRIVEIFDKSNVSFVSVTQSFNTTTSMGRLTLNVLLSFAQFEREVTGERIRDKIAASKKKGMWMGGFVPIGYTPNERTLEIEESSAMLIRSIYQRYLELKNVRLLAEELAFQNILTPHYITASGKHYGGCAFSRGHIYRILSNPIYIGEIAHKGQLYEGQHPAIIDRATWDAVQSQLAQNCHERKTQKNVKDPNLLAGLIFDQYGQRLIGSFAVKNNRRYRYYIAQGIASKANAPVLRLSAHRVEQAVLHTLYEFLSDHARLAEAVTTLDLSPTDITNIYAHAKSHAEALKSTTTQSRIALMELLEQVTIEGKQLTLNVKLSALLANIQLETAEGMTINITGILALKPKSGKTLQVASINHASTKTNHSLLKSIARGVTWYEDLITGRCTTLREIAARENVTERYIAQQLRYAFLPPEVVKGVLSGGMQFRNDIMTYFL